MTIISAPYVKILTMNHGNFQMIAGNTCIVMSVSWFLPLKIHIRKNKPLKQDISIISQMQAVQGT